MGCVTAKQDIQNLKRKFEPYMPESVPEENHDVQESLQKDFISIDEQKFIDLGSVGYFEILLRNNPEYVNRIVDVSKYKHFSFIQGYEKKLKIVTIFGLAVHYFRYDICDIILKPKYVEIFKIQIGNPLQYWRFVIVQKFTRDRNNLFADCSPLELQQYLFFNKAQNQFVSNTKQYSDIDSCQTMITILQHFKENLDALFVLKIAILYFSFDHKFFNYKTRVQTLQKMQKQYEKLFKEITTNQSIQQFDIELVEIIYSNFNNKRENLPQFIRNDIFIDLVHRFQPNLVEFSILETVKKHILDQFNKSNDQKYAQNFQIFLVGTYNLKCEHYQDLHDYIYENCQKNKTLLDILFDNAKYRKFEYNQKELLFNVIPDYLQQQQNNSSQGDLIPSKNNKKIDITLNAKENPINDQDFQKLQQQQQQNQEENGDQGQNNQNYKNKIINEDDYLYVKEQPKAEN